MVELRWVVPEGTFIPGKEYPKLQYRVKEQKFYGKNEPTHMDWSEWKDVRTVVVPNAKLSCAEQREAST